MANKTIQLKRSSELNVNGDGPKLPTKDKLEYGEIAINFAVGHETISLKNSNDEIVPIKINGDGKVLTQNDVVDQEPEILTDDYKKKPVSAFRSFNGLKALADRIYGKNGLNSKVVSNSTAIDSNKTNIATNTNAINGLTTGIDKIAVEIHGDGTTDKPGLIKKVKSNENNIAANKKEIFGDGTPDKPGLIKKVENVDGDLKSFMNDIYKEDQKNIDTRLTALENQLNGVETQTTRISNTANDIITNAQ